jgi:hypothetical protein
VASPYSPSLPDPINLGWGGVASDTLSVSEGPFGYNNTIYMLLNVSTTNGAAINAVQILKFDSSSNTWTVLDQAHEPNPAYGTWVFDGAHTVYVAYVADGGQVSGQTVNLATFNLQTELWSGPLTASNKPTATFAYQLYANAAAPQPGLVLLCDDNNLGSGALLSYAFVAGAWAGSVMLNAQWNGDVVCGCLDGALLLTWSDLAGGPNGQVVFASLAGDYTTVVSQTYPDPGTFTGWLLHCNAVMVNGSAWLPLVVGDPLELHGNYQTFALVDPATGNFTIMPAPGIDPGEYNNPALTSAGFGVYFQSDGATVTSISTPSVTGGGGNGGANAFRINQTTALAGFGTWQNLPGYSLNDGPPDLNFFLQEIIRPTVFFDGSNVVVSAEMLTPNPDNFDARYYMGNFTPVVVVPTIIPPGITGGLPYVVDSGVAIGGCRQLNQYDDCALAEVLRFRKINLPPLCVMPEGVDPYAMPWDEDYGGYPEQIVPFNKTGGITTPAPIAGDQIVFSFRVPSGYDGLMTALYFQYSGSGFSQGSGDIIFRIRKNQVFLKDLSNTFYLLGAPRLPVPMTQGAVLLSNQLVSLIVNVPNLSGNIQVGQSTVFGGLIGFFWPRG